MSSVNLANSIMMRSASSNHVPNCAPAKTQPVSQPTAQPQPPQIPTTSEDYLNKKITFIQNHINNLLIEITNLPEPWSYAVTEDGRVFFINETDRQTTWLHPKTGQPVSIMIIPPIEDLPNGWQKDYILGLPYLIDHNTKRNLPISEHAKPTATDYQQTDSTPKIPAKKNSPPPVNQSTDSMEQNLTSSTCSNSSVSSSSRNDPPPSNGNTNELLTSAAIDSALRKCGWLHKLSQNGLKLWRKRYFVLTDYILDYYSDSTRTKHCGTIFLNSTHSRPTVKKDGSSAYNKKNSFKVELIQPDSEQGESGQSNSDNYIFLAADSPTLMNEWISNFNFVSQMKNNSQSRNLYEKRASNRSLSNTSLRTSTANNNGTQSSASSTAFLVKHDQSSTNRRSSKSNSAPNSPTANRHSIVVSDATAKAASKKLRSSLSSNRIEDPTDPAKKSVKKKLAFSDDEILKDQPPKQHSSNGKKAGMKLKSKIMGVRMAQSHEFETDYESNENLSGLKKDGFDENLDSSKHKRSSSLTKAMKLSNYTNSSGLSSARSNRSSNTMLYDYRPIYEAFEKPIIDAEKSMGEQQIGQQKAAYKTISNIIARQNQTEQPAANSHQQYVQNGGVRFVQNGASNGVYYDKKKIATATSAAAAAVEKERDPGLPLSYPKKTTPTQPNQNKSIGNFYSLSKSQIEFLPKNEAQMLIRQLRRNFVLLNHSQQRFSLLHKLYEPYELIYQHRQHQPQLSNNGKADESFNNISDLANQMHDSFQTINDRLKKIENKMDSIDSAIKLAQQCESPNGNINGMSQSQPTLYEDINFESFLSSPGSSLNGNKYANLLKLYEYQIVEMQHEYELLLEDKIIVDKLLDNQMRIFSKYKNLSNEKFLIQQFNALNQEMDLLQSHLSKVNQLLNDTIADKCKHEIMHERQQQQQRGGQNSGSEAENKGSLFRASLVPVGAPQTHNGTPTSQSSSESPTTSNNSNHTSSSHLLHNQMKTLVLSSQQFGSSDNILNNNQQSHFKQPNNVLASTNQPHQPVVRPGGGPAQPNLSYLIANQMGGGTRLNGINSDMSKSIDSIYTAPSSTATNSSQKMPNSSSGGYNGAFNSVRRQTARPNELTVEEKKSPVDQNGQGSSSSDNSPPPPAPPPTNNPAGKDIHISFQPVNFINYRPKPMSLYQQPGQLNNSGFKPTNFKRDLIAEKKRSSIGKSPHNYYVVPNVKPPSAKPNEYFQPIPVQHCRQSARERLFGGQNNGVINQQSLAAAMAAAAAAAAADNDQSNNRKIAFVKPEMRGRSPENQQNQMEYFDGDYSEELVKNIQKPDVFSIPRGSMDVEPEAELTEEEKRTKEKKVLEIKKMIALQSLQPMMSMNLNDNVYSNGSSAGSETNHTNNNVFNYVNSNSHYSDYNFEREKRAREQLLDLKHELAEQIKEKTRQMNSATSSSSTNGVVSASLSPSFTNELDNQIADHSSSSIYVTKMAQTFDRMHANTSKSLNNESFTKSFVPIRDRK